ncbi:MAG: class I SAM-dependent methyltransferase [Verrucomicrobia bacterium]|nr:class I SAM-dependent methyltransferase [Verrucomicrobiota bacterium]
MTNPSPAAGSLARRLVLPELAKLTKGRLVLRLPEGAELVLGDPRATGGARMDVKDENAFRRIMLAADIGLTEGYMEGEWDSPDLNALIGFFIENIDQTPGMSGSARKALGVGLFRIADRIGHLLRPNDKQMVRRNISEHYDVSNDFFRLFLDPSMMYSSARWEGTDSLEQAQANKNDSLCRFLQLKPTDHVIEIGTGWGGWALHAVKKYGCRVTSLTISQAQHDLAVERVKAAGLADRITVKLEDFRDHQGSYDKCVSIEMMEALGHKYLPAFCASIGRLLKPDGIAAFQYITCPDSRYAQFRDGVDFIQKHIFPGSLLLSINRVGELMTQESGFQLDRLEEFGPDYARTLDAWCRAFEANLDKVRGMGFDERFIRKWRLYFRYCQAAFAHRNIGVVQAVYVRPNRKG